MPKSKTTGKALQRWQEKTAVISILAKEGGGDDESIHYLTSVTFSGAVPMPPYLKLSEVSVSKRDRDRLVRKIDSLEERIFGLYKAERMFLGREESREIFDEIVDVGRGISTYLRSLTLALQQLRKAAPENIIIYTNDFRVPWGWICYPDSAEEPDTEEFLCGRYPLGFLIADSGDGPYRMMETYFRKNNSSEAIIPKLKAFLIQGKMFGGERGEEHRRNYVRELEKLLKHKRFSDREQVRVPIPDDGDRDGSNSGEMYVWKLVREGIDQAKVIHFTGHVEQNCLKLDERLSVTSGDLNKRLTEFINKPLIVLHGCLSGKVKSVACQDANLPTTFLHKGAGGCLATLMPVEVSLTQNGAKKSVALRFLKKVMKYESYGKSLFHAIQEFRRDPDTCESPQWLFFQLYGDPREALADDESSHNSSWRNVFEMVNKDLDKSVRENRVDVTATVLGMEDGEEDFLNALVAAGVEDAGKKQHALPAGDLTPLMDALQSSAVHWAAISLGGAIAKNVFNDLYEVAKEWFVKELKASLKSKGQDAELVDEEEGKNALEKGMKGYGHFDFRDGKAGQEIRLFFRYKRS